MKLFTQAKETLQDVSGASQQVVQTTEWATVALIAVAGVAVAALLYALAALSEVRA